MKIILPIAGRGSRFKAEADKNPEYNKPKPLINVRGYPMVRWATGSLPFIKHKGREISGDLMVESKDLIFIALKEHEDNFQISKVLKNIYDEDITIVFLDTVTRGAAETVLCAKDYINNTEPIIISDSDHFFAGESLVKMLAQNSHIDGLIPVFKVETGDTKWSFSRLGADGFVDLVAEKQPISAWANIGAYYFGKGSDFVSIAEETIANGEYVNNEFYIAPLYNKLIQGGGKVKLAFPEYVYGLGTPGDLDFFLATTDYAL